MTDSPRSAEILAFPLPPQDRLRAATRRLEQALQEQAEALASLRSNLAALGSAVGGLQTSLNSYQGRLSATAGDVSRAHAAARALEGRADSMLGMDTALPRA